MQIKKELTCRECAFLNNGGCPCNSATWRTDQRSICKGFKSSLPQYSKFDFQKDFPQVEKLSGIKEVPFVCYTKYKDKEKDQFYGKTPIYMVKTKDYIENKVFATDGELNYFAKGYYVKDNSVKDNSAIQLAKWHVDIYEDCKEAETLHTHDHTIYEDGNVIFKCNEYDWPIGWHAKGFSDISPKARTTYIKSLAFALDEYHKDFASDSIVGESNSAVKLYLNADNTPKRDWKAINRDIALKMMNTLKKVSLQGDEVNLFLKQSWPAYFQDKKKVNEKIPVIIRRKNGSNQSN